MKFLLAAFFTVTSFLYPLSASACSQPNKLGNLEIALSGAGVLLNREALPNSLTSNSTCLSNLKIVKKSPLKDILELGTSYSQLSYLCAGPNACSRNNWYVSLRLHKAGSSGAGRGGSIDKIAGGGKPLKSSGIRSWPKSVLHEYRRGNGSFFAAVLPFTYKRNDLELVVLGVDEDLIQSLVVAMTRK